AGPKPRSSSRSRDALFPPRASRAFASSSSPSAYRRATSALSSARAPLAARRRTTRKTLEQLVLRTRPSTRRDGGRRELAHRDPRSVPRARGGATDHVGEGVDLELERLAIEALPLELARRLERSDRGPLPNIDGDLVSPLALGRDARDLGSERVEALAL